MALFRFLPLLEGLDGQPGLRSQLDFEPQLRCRHPTAVQIKRYNQGRQHKAETIQGERAT